MPSSVVAHSLLFVVWYLSKNPEAFERLKKEIRETFTSQDAINQDSANKLPYLNAVLEESMRIFPPVPEGPPRVSPGEMVDGHYIPAGIYVSSHIWYIHRHPELIERPDSFEPERWLEGSGKPWTLPFIIGPRACIGITLAYVEMRIALAKLVFRYDWTLAPELNREGYDWPSECRLQQLWKRPPLKVKLSAVSR